MTKAIKTGKYWDKAWQLTDGCTKCSTACDNCWSEAMAKRFYSNPFDDDFRRPKSNKPFNWEGKIALRHDNLDLPLRTKKNGKPLFPKPTRFAIWNDLFHEKVPFEFIDEVFRVFGKVGQEQHTYLMLTKRPKRMQEYFIYAQKKWMAYWPYSEVWLGCTPYKEGDIETLLQIPAAHHFVSYEPLLEKPEPFTTQLIECRKCKQKSLANLDSKRPHKNWVTTCFACGSNRDVISNIDWVIVGAETGSKARYCPLEHIENVVQQCKAAGVKVWVKAVHIGTEKKFRIVHKFSELPESVRIREYPEKDKEAV